MLEDTRKYSTDSVIANEPVSRRGGKYQWCLSHDPEMARCAAMIATAFPKVGLPMELSHTQGHPTRLRIDFRTTRSRASHTYLHWLFSEFHHHILAYIGSHATNGSSDRPPNERTRHFHPVEESRQLPTNHVLDALFIITALQYGTVSGEVFCSTVQLFV